MGLGWFLIPTLGGYWFLTHLHFTRYGALRDSGYHVFFRAALAGGILAAFARVIVLFLNHYFPQINEVWGPYAPFPYSGTAVLSLLLGFVLPFVGNRFYSKEKAARRVARGSGDLIELLISESIEQQKLVEISLRSGKSYIGFALESGITRQGESDIALIPTASGYRDKDSQELNITTEYARVIQESLEEQSKSPSLTYRDFQIIIPISEIVSARVFYLEVYERFQRNPDGRMSEV